MLTELLEEDHGQEAWAGPAAGDDMERGRRLGDSFAVSAGELFPNVVDHLPLSGDDLEGLSDIFAELGEPCAAAGLAGAGTWHDHPLTRQVLREGLASGPLAHEGCDLGCPGQGRFGGQLVLGGRGLQLLELQLHLVEQAAGAL